MTRRTRIVQAIEAGLKEIRAGRPVPGQAPSPDPLLFQASVKMVSRTLNDPGPNGTPALFITDPTVYYRHLLQDVKHCTMRMFISGITTDYTPKALEQMDMLYDDVEAVLTYNQKWGGLVRRSRIVSADVSVEVGEPDAGFTFVYEVDFVETNAIPRNPSVLDPLPVEQPGQPWMSTVTHSLHNAFLDLEEVSHVEISDLWPIPPEQLSRSQCPGVWFTHQTESFQYHASRLATKTASYAVLLVDVQEDARLFRRAVDTWGARLKDCLGRHADLEGRVLTVDLQAIRGVRSDFPVVMIEADLLVRYMQSFEEN